MMYLAMKNPYRTASVIAVGTALLLIWLSLGVGIIGKDGDPANIMYFGVLGVGLAGAIITRCRPHGLSNTLIATALAQFAVTAIALVARLGLPWSGPAEILLLNGFFIVSFLTSAWLFKRSIREREQQSA
jgi:hypothetical protein